MTKKERDQLDLAALMQLVEDYTQSVVRCFQSGKDGHSAANAVRKREKKKLETVLEGLIQ